MSINLNDPHRKRFALVATLADVFSRFPAPATPGLPLPPRFKTRNPEISLTRAERLKANAATAIPAAEARRKKRAEKMRSNWEKQQANYYFTERWPKISTHQEAA